MQHLGTLAVRLAVCAMALACVSAALALVGGKHGESDSAIVLTSARMSPLAPGGSDPFAQPLTVGLPDAWNPKRQQGRWLYQLSFSLEAPPQEEWALYIPRAGNRVHIALNGRSIAQLGSFGQPSGDFTQRPHYVLLRGGVLHQGVNELDITLEGERNRYAGLSQVHVGPDRELRPAYTRRQNAQLGGSLVAVALCSTFGLLALALYGAVRQPSDAFFALACFFCSVRLVHVLVEHVPFDYRLWTWLIDMCYAGMITTIVVFCVQALNIQGRLWRLSTWLFVVASLVLVSWHTAAQRNDVRQLWTLLMLVFVLGFSLTIIWRWWRQRTPVSALLAAAAGAGVAMGAYDHWLVYYARDGYGGFAVARFALVFFILAMGWIIVGRVVARIQEERLLREALASELAHKKTELATEYGLNMRLASQRAQMLEREKLIQELHDGMGLQLNSLLGLVEKGDARPEEVQTEVRNSIEQLRTLVDGSESFEGSLAELLGHIRHRIEGRLKRQGIGLSWHNRAPGDAARVRPLAAVSLQRLVFELCTNVIKHAKASCVTVVVDIEEAPGDGARLRLHFEDDGRCAAPGQPERGTGHKSVLRRVQELEGEHQQAFGPGHGCRHTVCIPLRNLLAVAA